MELSKTLKSRKAVKLTLLDKNYAVTDKFEDYASIIANTPTTVGHYLRAYCENMNPIPGTGDTRVIHIITDNATWNITNKSDLVTFDKELGLGDADIIATFSSKEVRPEVISIGFTIELIEAPSLRVEFSFDVNNAQLYFMTDGLAAENYNVTSKLVLKTEVGNPGPYIYNYSSDESAWYRLPSHTTEIYSLPYLANGGLQGLANLTKVHTPSISGILTISYLTNGCTKLTDVKFGGVAINSSAVAAFSNTAITELDLSTLDFSKTTDMTNFISSSKVKDIKLNGDTLKSVQSFVNFAAANSGITEFKPLGWKTSSLINLTNMFLNCAKLEEVDFFGMDVSNVTNLLGLFYHCVSLQKVNFVDGFPKCGNLTSVFLSVSKLLDFSKFLEPSRQVTDLHAAFLLATGLSGDIDLSHWSVAKGARCSSSFYGTSIRNLKFPDLIDSPAGLFTYSCKALETISFKTFKPTAFDSGCAADLALRAVTAEHWDLSSCTNLRDAFYNCYNLTELDTSDWDLSNCVDLQLTFCNCYNLTKLEMAKGPLATISLYRTFLGTNLTTLPEWVKSCKVNNMSGTFLSSQIGGVVDLSSMDASTCATALNLFYNCKNITEVKLPVFAEGSNFTCLVFNTNLEVIDLSNLKAPGNCAELSRDCSKCRLIKVGDWDMTNCTSFTNIFYGCSRLTRIEGRMYNILMPMGQTGDKRFDYETALMLINGLADLTGKPSQTFSFSSYTKSLLSEEEIAIATAKNWTIA